MFADVVDFIVVLRIGGARLIRKERLLEVLLLQGEEVESHLLVVRRQLDAQNCVNVLEIANLLLLELIVVGVRVALADDLGQPSEVRGGISNRLELTALLLHQPNSQELNVQLVFVLVLAEFLDNAVAVVKILNDLRTAPRIIRLSALKLLFHLQKLSLHVLLDEGRVAQLQQVPLNRDVQLLYIFDPKPFGLIPLRVPLVVHYFVVFAQVLEAQEILILFPDAVLLQL